MLFSKSYEIVLAPVPGVFGFQALVSLRALNPGAFECLDEIYPTKLYWALRSSQKFSCRFLS